jgi:hypothetical protein
LPVSSASQMVHPPHTRTSGPSKHTSEMFTRSIDVKNVTALLSSKAGANSECTNGSHMGSMGNRVRRVHSTFSMNHSQLSCTGLRMNNLATIPKTLSRKEGSLKPSSHLEVTGPSAVFLAFPNCSRRQPASSTSPLGANHDTMRANHF